MRALIPVATVVALVLGGAGGYFELEYYPRSQFRAVIEQSIAKLPPGVTVTYGAVNYSIFTRVATLSGLKIHWVGNAKSPQPVDATIDSIKISNPNQDLPQTWADAQANPAIFGQDTSVPVADTIVVSGVSFHAGAVDAKQATLSIGKPRLYPWALLHGGVPTFAALWAAGVPGPQPPSVADLAALLRFDAAAMLGIAYDGYDAEGLSVTAHTPALDLVYDIRKMAGAGFDRGVLKGGTVEGVTSTTSKFGTVAFDRVTMGAFDIREPATRIIDGEALSMSMLNGIALGRIDYDGITVRPVGKPEAHAGGMSLGPVSFAQGKPVSAAFALRDFRIEQSQVSDPRVRESLARFGLEHATISFALAYDWDVAGQTARIHDTSLKVDELGTLTLSADLTNVVANSTPLTLAEVRLGHTRLRLEDASLVDRLLRVSAAQAGVDVEAYRRRVASILQQPPPPGGEISPEMIAVRQALAAFITAPKTLTMELAPPEPVPVVLLRSAAAAPAGLATMLGLTVTANGP